MDGTEPGGKVKRIADETKGLVEDVKSWVDLRLQLTQLEVEGRVNDATAKGIIGVVAGFALVFALIGLALLIGEWMGKSYWGFFVVAGVLFIVTAVVWMAKPKIVKIEPKKLNKS